MENSIPLSQKLYLLGIHPEKGGIVSSSYSAMNFLLSGAMLLELFKNGNIKFKDKRVVLIHTKTNNATHKFLLDKISAAKSPRRISSWINRFNMSNKKIREGVQKELSEKRIIRMQAKQFLFFKWESPAIMNKSLVYHLVDNVKEQIFRGTSVEEELILLSFIRPGKLLYRLYPDRQKRHEADKKLKNLLVDNPVSKSVEEAIQAAQVVAASIAVNTAVSATH
ncbi:GPP34 family phosphoprotein [uncultured Draconibacterium sp.]|uniref:GOLPH3/VPS74 family protein n=1 Tax=uncultured Draconibacterium sp. TaxID=1573823 RepID=UPI0032178BB4